MEARREITGDIRKDIILFSSILNTLAADKTGLTLHTNTSNNDILKLLTHLSNILILGTEAHPFADQVHAVSGQVTDFGVIECIVCAENTSANTGEARKGELNFIQEKLEDAGNAEQAQTRSA